MSDSIHGPASDSPTPLPTPTETVRLANATVGKPFETTVDLSEYRGAPFHEEASFHDWLTSLGLSARVDAENPDALVIAGTPTADGEHFFFLDLESGGKVVRRRELLLTINPDPRSLWKELEPDPKAPYQKAHTDTQFITNEEFAVISASRRGRSHAHAGSFREDDFSTIQTEDGWIGAVVSDGAGSCAFSREGSKLACRTTATFLSTSLPGLEERLPALVAGLATGENEETVNSLRGLFYPVLAGAAFAAFKRIEQEATAIDKPLREFSATLLVAVAKRFPEGVFVAAFGIGDGAIGLYDDSRNEVHLLNTPDGGEFSGQTRFLTMREVIGDGGEMAKRMAFRVVDNPAMLALMTDGISDPKFGTDRNLHSAEKWKDFYGELSEAISSENSNDPALKLLEWLNFWSPGEHDDRTLALILPVA